MKFKAYHHRFYFCLVAISILLGYGIFTANENDITHFSFQGFFNLGIGAVHPTTLISGLKLPSIGGSTVVASVLLTNIAQPIVSFLYLLANGVITSMLLAEEWSHFAHNRKALRVSKPRPGQRSTYFL
jgi:hypothetical protein